MSEEKPKKVAKEVKKTAPEPMPKERFDKLLKGAVNTPPPKKGNKKASE